ncbi:MAG: metal-dependent hydrolase [archaeon]
MKGREHENLAEVLALVFGVLIIISLSFQTPVLSPIINFFGLTWFIAALFLFVLGSVLPDSDSVNMGSYIFFKGFFKYVGFLFKGLEYPITLITKRERGHRKSLHTVLGISITSLVLIIFLSLVASFLGLFEWRGAFLALIFLFLGQLLHLVCDLPIFQADKAYDEVWKIRWR